MNSLFQYRIYDFNLSSTFPLPELWPVADPDIQLNITDQEPIPPLTRIDKEGWMYEDFLFIQIGQEGTIILIKDVCRIWLKSADTLVLEPLPGVDAAEIRVYLLGSGLAMYLMSRGYFTLHAGTITNGATCISFMGDSGVGKSTTCTYFIDRGYRLLADDVSLVKLSPQATPMVYAALPALKLWPDSLQQLQRDPEFLPLVTNSESKRRLALQDAFSPAGNVPLKCIFLLEPSDQVERPTLTRLQGKDSFDAISNNIYRVEAVTWLGQTANHFHFCTQLARQVPVFRLQRPLEPFDVEAIYQLVEQTINTL